MPWAVIALWMLLLATVSTLFYVPVVFAAVHRRLAHRRQVGTHPVAPPATAPQET